MTQKPSEAARASLDGAARQTVRSWLRHPATVPTLMKARPKRLIPIDQQVSVVAIFATVFGATLEGIDGELEPAPPPPRPRRARKAAIEAAARVIDTAERLVNAGVPIEPAMATTYIVLAQLLNLPIDLSADAEQIEKALIVPSLGWYDGSGRIHGSTTTTSRELRALHALAAPHRLAGVGGVRRAGSTATPAARIEAGIRAAISVDPNLTPDRFLKDWDREREWQAAFETSRYLGTAARPDPPDLKTLRSHWPRK